MMLIKKRIEINSRKSLQVYKTHLLRKREESKLQAEDQIREMTEYWTVGRILRTLTHSSAVPLITEGLVGAATAYATKSYAKPIFIKNAFSGIVNLFRKKKSEAVHNTY